MPRRMDRDENVCARLPPSLRSRVDELVASTGKPRAIIVRGLIGAALGDDASAIAVRESVLIADSIRRELLREISVDLGPIFERVNARFEERAASGHYEVEPRDPHEDHE